MSHKEIDGEILPAYDGVNQPRYPRGENRDTEMPHEFSVTSTEVINVDTPSEERAVRERDEHRNNAISHLGPVAVSPELAEAHNRSLDRIRKQLGR